MRFSGKRVLVTGGARGIGAACARAFAEEGARVAVNATSEASINACRKAHGRDYIGVAGAVGGRDACHAVVNEAAEKLGGLDVLTANAGVFAEVPFEDVDQAEFDRSITVNLAGVFFCAQAALPMLRESGGNITAVASDAGVAGYSGAPAYAAAKHGVVGLVRSLALACAATGVRVNCVCPGNVDTDMIAEAARKAADESDYLRQARRRAPMGRMARAEEIAAAVLYLASDGAGFTTGAALPVDGGGLAGRD